MVKKRKKHDYIDKKHFSQLIEDYVEISKLHKLRNEQIPRIPDEIGKGFMLICDNLSRLPNFHGYTYREDMVMDAVENCLKAIHGFNPNAYTKSGKPNAFGYFTQIAWYAMLRRIQKEKKVLDIKNKILETATPLDFVDDKDDISRHYIENILAYNIKD